MKYQFIFVLFFSWSCGTALQAQVNKAKKYLSKGDFEAAITAFEKDAHKTLYKPLINEAMSKIYFDPKFEDYNLVTSYLYIQQAIRDYDNLNSKERKKIQKKGVSKIAMSKLMSDIIIEAQNKIEAAPSIDTVNHFLATYAANANKSQIEKATKQRNHLVLANAQKENTYPAFLSLWDLYSNSLKKYNSDLYLEAQKGLLESYIAEKSWVMYPAFEEKYPDNIYVKDEVAAYALIKIYKKQTFENLIDYTEAYPNSPFKKFAIDYLYQMTLDKGKLEDYDYFVRTYPNYSKIQKIWVQFEALYAKANGTEAAKKFIQSHPSYTNKNN